MMNLFSIFDPSLAVASLNWVFLFTPLFLVFNYWVCKSKVIMWMIILKNIITKEMKYILSYSSSSGIMILISVFILIMMNNFMGLFPYVYTSTSHIMITVSLALPMWMMVILYSWVHNTNTSFSHLVPLNTPAVLMPFMVLIETISNLIRPLTLSLRLAANMVAGHLLITLLSSSNLLEIDMSVYISGLFLCFLEMAVAVIQSYVFMILCSLYMSEVK